MEPPSILERLRAFNRWTKGWAGSIAVAVGIWIVLRSYLIEAFRIPSASMENTLLVGDFLFVNKAVYGGQLEIPFTGVRFWHLPGYAQPRQMPEADAREGDLELSAVDRLVDEQEVTHEQSVLHARRGDAERLDQVRSEHDPDEQGGPDR